MSLVSTAPAAMRAAHRREFEDGGDLDSPAEDDGISSDFRLAALGEGV